MSTGVLRARDSAALASPGAARFLLALLVGLALGPSAAAQHGSDVPLSSGSRPATAWPVRVSVGLGVAHPYRSALSANVELGNVPAVQGGFLVITSIDALDQNPVLTALHAGVGVSHSTSRGRGAAFVAPAWVLSRDETLSESSGIGIVARAQATYPVNAKIGVGVSTFVNVNAIQSGYGAAVVLSFGEQ